MPGRHVRRAPSWWFRRGLVVMVVLVVGAAIGAGGWWVADRDEDPVTAGTGAAVLTPTGRPISIVLAGEISPGTALPATSDGRPSLGGFDDLVGGAGLAIVDLSAAVVGRAPADPGSAAWAPAGVLDALEAVGVDVVSLANDRALDLGADGLAQTLAAAEGRRLAVAGIGANEVEAYRPVVRQVGGVTVAVVTAAQSLAPERIASDTATADRGGVASAKRIDRLVSEVEAAAADADVVVAYLHWGEAGQACPSAGPLELAAALVAAGADVVAGSGTGTVQGAGRLDGAVVAYGLGTLVGDAATEAGALVVEVDRSGVTGWRWVPGTVVDGVARPGASPDEAVTAELAARRECALLAR